VVYVVGSGRCQTWQHVYTAVTRGRRQVIVVTRKSMLDWALENPPITRLTGLKEKLINILNVPLHSVTHAHICAVLRKMYSTLSPSDNFVAKNVSDTIFFCNDNIFNAEYNYRLRLSLYALRTQRKFVGDHASLPEPIREAYCAIQNL